MSNFATYMIGVLLLTAALAYGAFLLGLGPHWIAVGALLVFGLGVMGAVKRTRRREPSPAE